MKTHNNIVCLLGADGSGKTTLLNYCVQDLRLPINVVGWSDYKDDVLREFGIEAFRLQYEPPQRRAQMVYYMLEKVNKHLMQLSEKGSEYVIVDCYWYRFFAKEYIYEKAAPWLFNELRKFFAPHLTIYLAIDLNQAHQNKQGDISPYECLYDTKSKEDFVVFQQMVMDVALEEAWKQSMVIDLMSYPRPVNEIALDFISLLKKELNWKI